MSVLPSPSIQMARSLNTLAVTDVANMTAVDLFQRQLESGSTEAAVDAMKRLGVVSVMAGPEESVNTILPYLTTTVSQQSLSDELLLIMGQQLIEVSKVVSVATEFLPLLERLASVEETVVRDQAVTVLQHLCRKSAQNRTPETDASIPTWMAVVKRLQGADWFTPKVSAAGVVPALLELVGENNMSQQYELLNLYKELCADETPMVRRAAAKHLGTCLLQAGWTHRDFGSTQVSLLSHDEQDSVRLLAVASLAVAGPSYAQHPTWTVQHWLPILKDGSTDMSWRVRNNLAKNFSDVAAVLGIQGEPRYLTEQSLVMACFVAMLTDAEAEVRAAGVGHLARMVAWGGPAHFQQQLAPLLPALADDVVMEVRSKCALALMDAAHGGTLEDAVILQAFGPLLESFLQDEFHEVQLQVLANLDKIAHLLPGLSGVVTSLLQMSKATNWRVRQAVAKLLPHLAEARGLDFFSSVLLEPAWLTLLLDPVASVRSSIVSGMALLVRVTGQDFMISTLLPQHVRIYNQNSNTYLIRSTIVHAHVETAMECKSGQLWQDALVQILRGLSDKVPNVRMVAAKGLIRMVVDGDAAIVQAQIRPALEKRIQEDDNNACRQACQEALEQIK